MKVIILAVLALLTVNCASDSKEDLNIMSFNVRYDNPSDSLNNWHKRKGLVVETIKSNDVDICGMQEVLAHQFDYLQQQLQGYTFIGVAREDGVRAGEFSNIIFKTDKFKLIDSDTFWISSTPDIVGSFGWDAACTRIATWVMLECLDSGKKVFVINTHLDHAGEMARSNGIKLILEKLNTLCQGEASVIMGDFNATPESDAIMQIEDSKLFVESRSVAIDVKGPQWTFHNFGNLEEDKRVMIDYIFVNDKLSVSQHTTIFSEQRPYMSDHTPIFIKATI